MRQMLYTNHLMPIEYSFLCKKHEFSILSEKMIKFVLIFLIFWKIEELQGGTISLKSKLGYGSEFIIELSYQELVENALEEIAIYDVNNNKEQIKIEFSDIYL